MTSFNISDLTPEEQESLVMIRRKKTTLIEEIQRIQEEMEQVNTQIENLGVTEDGYIPSAKHVLIGRKKFNNNPREGIDYLINHKVIEDTPDSIAEFLFRTDGLSKAAIGEYIGEKSEKNVKILERFVDLHDLSNMPIVMALRQFLWSFRLPGESQKIDRMMEAFAKRYCDQNQRIFSHKDTCYVLSFSIIMLNTCLHNPNVKEKTSLEGFISMNRGINQGKDLSSDMLTNIYESIRAEPFKIPDEEGIEYVHAFFNPEREGYLWKQGWRYKSWKRRWFVLNDKCLYYFELTPEKEPRGIIPLENIKVRMVEDKSKQHAFELYSNNADVIKACKTESDGRLVEGKHAVYRLAASNSDEMHSWINAIQRSINKDPFFDMLQLRRKRISSAPSESSSSRS